MSNETDKPMAGALRAVRAIDAVDSLVGRRAHRYCEDDCKTLNDIARIIASESGLVKVVTALEKDFARAVNHFCDWCGRGIPVWDATAERVGTYNQFHRVNGEKQDCRAYWLRMLFRDSLQAARRVREG